MTLPIVPTNMGHAVVDPDTGEVVAVEEATDRALAVAAEELARVNQELFAARRALAAELRARHGVGTCHAGGYAFTVRESTSWPVGATIAALHRLVAAGHITAGDVQRAVPKKPQPDARQLKALCGRLAVSKPEAARVLAEACTVSPPSVKDVVPESLDEVEGADVIAGLEQMNRDRSA
jgi:hypothetical protein